MDVIIHQCPNLRYYHPVNVVLNGCSYKFPHQTGVTKNIILSMTEHCRHDNKRPFMGNNIREVSLFHSRFVDKDQDINQICRGASLRNNNHGIANTPLHHESEVIWASRRLESPTTRLLIQQFIQANNKNIKICTTNPLVWGKFTRVTDGFPSQRDSNAESVSMSWRHHT